MGAARTNAEEQRRTEDPLEHGARLGFLSQTVRVAYVERSGNLVVLDDRAELEDGRCRSKRSDTERVEEVGDEAETEQAPKVEAARSVSRSGHRSRYRWPLQCHCGTDTEMYFLPTWFTLVA